MEEDYQNIDNYPKRVRAIIQILLHWEDNLSDGYCYYSGGGNESIETLTNIADEIFDL